MKISKSDDELHVYLNVPHYAAKALFRWVKEQEWPKDTEFEDQNEYHATLLYSPFGYQDWHNGFFIPNIEKITTQIVSVDNFGPDEEGKTAYVLRLQSDELQAAGDKIQKLAASIGIVDTHFGSYKPHITIGYGYAEVDIQSPNMELDLGPVEVSSPRIDINATPSLEGIAKDLHNQYNSETSPTDIVEYTSRKMDSVNLPTDELAIQAALQTWQTIYPQDKIITSDWDFNSPFEQQVVNQYEPHGLSVLYDETPDNLDISHIEVDPRSRNQGIGSKFMNDAYQYALNNGKQLSVSRVDNQPFFNKFPFLNQVEDKRFVSASLWDKIDYLKSIDEQSDKNELDNVDPAQSDNWDDYQGEGTDKDHGVSFGNDTMWLN